MGLIVKFHTWVDGQIPLGLITAERLNTNFDRLYTLVNGELDEDNIENPCKIVITDRAYTATGYHITGNWTHEGTITFSGSNTHSGNNTFSGSNTFSGGITMTSEITFNAQNELRFADSDSSHYVGFEAPATISSNQIWVLPDADGSADQVLKTDGSGALDWVDNGGSGNVTTSNITEYGISLLSTTSSVDFSNSGSTSLYTVPAGKSAIITHLVIRSPSASSETPGWSCGWGVSGTDVVELWSADTVGVSAATFPQSSTQYIVVPVSVSILLPNWYNYGGGATDEEALYMDQATVGTASDVLYLTCNTGTANLTATIDVFGYLV